MHLPISLLTFVSNAFGNSVNVCTEYQQDVYKFRCHPYFQSMGPMYDWLFVLFDEGTFPCKLAVVVMTDNQDDPIQLVVQSASCKTNVQSVLLTEWVMSPEYYAVSPDTIVGSAFVISIKDDNSRILVTRMARHVHKCC
jgi:hypothetical protein